MPPLPRLRRSPLLHAAGLVAAACAAMPAAGQEADAAATVERDPRPRAHAYTVVDGRTVPAPLGAALGDAERGRAIYDDPALGGCRACHAAPGLPRQVFVPLALAGRAAMPELEPEPEATAKDPEAGTDDLDAGTEEDLSSSDSRYAPEAAAPPPLRPDPEALAAEAEAEAEAEEAETVGDGSGGLAPAAAALLPLPQGPDLAGAATRLERGELRLLVINPRIVRPGSRMPAYHNVSFAQAAITPSLRQPWLTAQEVEDVVAYLATLDDPEATEPEPAPAEAEGPAEAGAEPAAEAVPGSAADAGASSQDDAAAGQAGPTGDGEASEGEAETPASTGN
ncbi:c-type cytochrome [Albimonas sp. CAU 1670]|uniref:c-type cytochrome n=1 Tax=Albimonas sp. CAU 1670 TaxID=3032599 RepID=UPI0023D9A861|nr:c-type cytochrome [Albimonas sp. CAU 1670]MDF2232801.1 c-type cytochrome [Albimonas sp. CAU 1670]